MAKRKRKKTRTLLARFKGKTREHKQKRPKPRPKPKKRILSAKHRKAISRGLNAYWKRQREEFKAPEGFQTGKNEIEPMLNRALRNVMKEHGVDGDIRREINADMSIDWELRFAIPKRLDVNALRISVADEIKGALNAWISLGWRFMRDRRMTREEFEDYKEFQAGLQVHTKYQRMTRKGIGLASIVLSKILDSMRKNRRLKPWQLFAWIHWNLAGDKPR